MRNKIGNPFRALAFTICLAFIAAAASISLVSCGGNTTVTPAIDPNAIGNSVPAANSVIMEGKTYSNGDSILIPCQDGVFKIINYQRSGTKLTTIRTRVIFWGGVPTPGKTYGIALNALQVNDAYIVSTMTTSIDGFPSSELREYVSESGKVSVSFEGGLVAKYSGISGRITSWIAGSSKDAGTTILAGNIKCN